MGRKYFTLAEANQLLPSLSELLNTCACELSLLNRRVEAASKRYEEAGETLKRLDAALIDQALACKAESNLEWTMAELAKAQNEYVNRLDAWVERISSTGVILRSVADGLVDFPCHHGSFEYLLCWKLGEPEIRYWHLPRDGFAGRKPLAALVEYY